jgi:hypothetical protein
MRRSYVGPGVSARTAMVAVLPVAAVRPLVSGACWANPAPAVVTNKIVAKPLFQLRIIPLSPSIAGTVHLAVAQLLNDGLALH